ncbi:MAG TPA: DUF488 domain-containing protein [Flavitalea sp.]|nr:DUF488 domain-containing protein [Flavitalea sp.]
MPEQNNIIWTIGHSTRSLEEFVTMLRSFKIEIVADVRHFPASRKYPHFNKASLEVALPQHHIQYVHIISLGGRRKVNPASINTAWKNNAFRGYADYMETYAFKEGIAELISKALKQQTAFMCSEAVWWRCHRSMVADYLKVQGWKIMHIMDERKAQEHPYTSPARIINGELNYSDPSNF